MKKLFFISIFLVSCATTENYREKLKLWLGNDINGIIMQWGEPSYEYTMPSKNKIYTYLWVGKNLIPKGSYEATIKKLAFDTSSGINWCKTSFVTDEKNKIINFTFEGNWCKAR
jgi:hypothetical protein